jgi:hypothetical protein
VSEGTGVATVSRRRRRAQRVEPPATRVVGFAPAEGFADWPDTVRVVGSQPSLWGTEPEPEPPAATPVPGVVRLGPEALVVGGELALSREVGQSFVLMGLMAVVLTLFVGLGLLAVRMLV